METEKQVTGALEDLGAALRRQPSVRDDVMRRVTQHAAANGAPSPSPAARWDGRRMLAKLVAVAACILVGLLVWNPWGNGGIGATQAFAAAIAQVEAAGTFACRQVYTSVGEDGQEVVRETRFMFKEPDLERIENGEGFPEQVMITDYAKRLRLVVLPEDKQALLQDISTLYAVDDETGKLKPSALGTHARDDVLRISAQAVKDLGIVNLDGRQVWALRAAGDAEPTKTVYVNPADGKPVQVEIAWPSRKQMFAYMDIHIDVPIDEGLFSLEPPQGYAVEGGKDGGPAGPIDDMNGKMLAKMKYLVMECYKYSAKNGGKWPAKLDDLTTAGVDAQKLRTMLAAPDSNDGKPVILYRQPKQGETDVIVVYEAPEIRRGNHVVAGFIDGHSEVMTRKYFDELMKK